jgi:hypothetical protein
MDAPVDLSVTRADGVTATIIHSDEIGSRFDSYTKKLKKAKNNKNLMPLTIEW